MTKTEQAIQYFKNKDYKKAFRIFKTFKMGFTKEEQRIIQITNECINNERRKQFYEMLDIDVDKMFVEAKQIIKTKYNI